MQHRFTWHDLDGTIAAQELGASPKTGLSSVEAEERLKTYGPNKLQARRKKTELDLFLDQFKQPLVLILIVACIVTAWLGEWVDSSVIFGVVILNAVVGFFQEYKAIKAIESLAKAMRTEVTVLRDGKTLRLDSAVLVPGDIIILRSGDKVPADARILQNKNLRADESALTGESVPVEKNDSTLEEATVLAERRNMVFAGTLISYGQARALVVSTGVKTELGRISDMLESVDLMQTPLTKKIAAFSKAILWVILGLAAVSFAIGMWRGLPLVDSFMAAVALAVAAIPEGLPAAVTIILAIGVSRLAQRKAIIRRLPAVEALGSVTTICSDKTGTLTKNQMTVQQIYAGEAWTDIDGTGYDLKGSMCHREGPEENAALKACLLSGLLCNDSQIDSSGEQPIIQGDPTEVALIVSAAKGCLDHGASLKAFPRLDEIPFESELQYMATLHRYGEDKGIIFVKGSIERILDLCDIAMDSKGKTKPLDKALTLEAAEIMASQGLRVLALAQREVEGDKDKVGSDDLDGLVFLGLQGMIDPPRPEAIRAIAACHHAGIRVKMITGDHAATAVAIAQDLSLLPPANDGRSHGPLAMTGQEIQETTDEALPEKAAACAVFARVTPEQKLRLVQALQSKGEICAMTGDGVNDGPALKQADIGVAMGIAGTEAAKEASDMVLLDDNFATIEAAVEEGRGVFDNLVKFIAWTLPTNVGEGLVILMAVAFGATLPILPVQILWINMTTAICLGMMLAFEPKEAGIMSRPPRDPSTPILSAFIVQRVVMVGLLLLVAAYSLFSFELAGGSSDAAARTVAMNVFVIGEMMYLFSARSFLRSPFALGFFSNPWILIGSAAMIVLQMIITYVPFMNTTFGTEPIGVIEWVKIFAVSLAIFLIVEVEKKLRCRLQKKCPL